MNKLVKNPMPPEYAYLEQPLFEAQEHVFLINAELEKCIGDETSQSRVIALQKEKSSLIIGLKRDFEMQTWEDGPTTTARVEAVIDLYLGDEAYKEAKEGLSGSGKSYEFSTYWADKLDRNIAEYDKRYGIQDDARNPYLDEYDLSEFDDFDLD